MNSMSRHERTTRSAILTLCMVCVTTSTQPSGGLDRRGHAAASEGVSAIRTEGMNHFPPGIEAPTEPDPATRSRLSDAFARLPLCFEANQGQAASSAQFVSAGSGYKLLLSPSSAELAARQPNSKVRRELSMRLVNADPSAEMRGLDRLPTRANYFIGNDPSKWHTNVPTFARVICESVYPGVDMIYYGSQRQLEYDFVVAPGADPDSIRLGFEDAQKTAVDTEGNLIVQTEETEIRHNKPVAYQEADGVRREVSVAFNLLADGTAGFQIGDYDKSKELVIDPVLVFSTYLGGSLDDFGRGIFVDSTGSAYVLGDSQSADFVTHGSADNADIFIGKFVPNGGTFSYAFFGGMKNEFATGLAVDANGNTYISGSTQSDNLGGPISINPALSGPSDAFVIKLNPGSGTFFYSTLVGGAGDETAVSISIDDAGNAYISGKTTSTDFPTANAIQSSFGGGDSDAFVSKIAPDGSTLVYSTYLGGSGTENFAGRSGIAVDPAGNAYVTGDTQSTDFPLNNALRSTKSGGQSSFDAYVSKIDPSGSFVYSTYLGGDEDDNGLGIATDSSGNAYVTGRTRSSSFTGSGTTRLLAGTSDAFVAKLNPTGSAIGYLTFIGGVNGNESANAIVVDASNNAYVTGSAGPGFATVKSVQSYFSGGDDVFVARLSSAGAINFSTYLGGSGDEAGLGIAVDSAGSIYVTGFTDSETNLLTREAIRTENAGATDVLVAKIDPNTDPDGPLIYDVRFNGKQMIVLGQNFSNGAFVRVNDSPKQTSGGVDPSQILTSKQAGKKAKPGRTVQLQVENANGQRSNLFFVTRPA